MANTFFCLDIGETYIKAADAAKEGDLINISNLGYIYTNPLYYPGNTENTIEDQAADISKLINNLKISKKNVNIIIPDTFTYSQILEMPKLNEKELISAIKYQADQFVPMPIDDTSLDIEIIDEDVKEKKLLVLMVAAPRNFIEKIQKTVELAGLIPDAIENELNSISRFYTETMKGNPSNDGTIFINHGINSTSLYYFKPNSAIICSNYNFNIGYNLFTKEIQVNLNLDRNKSIEILKNYDGVNKSSYPIETIINPAVKEFEFEIKKFINSVSQKFQTKISNIYLANEAFMFPFLPKVLAANFSIPVSLINPYGIIKKSNLVDSYKDSLSLFTSTIGGNLR